MTCRIAIVQHGDYREALQIIGSGQVEPYFGMKYSLDVTERLLGDHPYLLISLNAPAYSERQGQGERVGLPCPILPKGIPKSVAMVLWGWKIRRLIRAFRPTHLLLKTGGILAEQVLLECRKEGIPTLVILAGLIHDEGFLGRRRNRRLIALLNDPIVARVGNHKAPATQSLIDAGLDPSKAVAWDWPGQKRPEDREPRRLGSPPFELVYVGSVALAKGVGDVVDACVLLHERGLSFRLSVLGDGPDLPAFREKAGGLPEGMVRFLGRVANDEVFREMCRATLIVVPSRHDFPEGMPLTLTEALASRTPVVASDHPVIAGAFREGEGMRFFRASDPKSLADAIVGILGDPEAYAALSRTTLEAYDRVECKVHFGDLIADWKREPGC